MNTKEKILRILGVVLIVAGAVLQVSHLVDYGNSRVLTTIGFVCSLLAYTSYARRLQAENDELRRQLPPLG